MPDYDPAAISTNFSNFDSLKSTETMQELGPWRTASDFSNFDSLKSTETDVVLTLMQSQCSDFSNFDSLKSTETLSRAR